MARRTAGIRTNIGLLEREVGELTYRLWKAPAGSDEAHNLERRRLQVLQRLDEERRRLQDGP